MSCTGDALSPVDEVVHVDVQHGDVARRFLKLDHLGEFIAVNIYCAQVRVAGMTCPELVPMLREFLGHEKRHLRIFQSEFERRGFGVCRGLRLLGTLGFLLGALTALLGTQGVLACTAAVETVVLEHLKRQLTELARLADRAALQAITSIVDDEVAHRQLGAAGGGALYRCVYESVALGTTAVINLGLRL